MAHHQTEHPSAYAALGRLESEAPSLPEALASAADLDASQRRDLVNSFNLGDQAVLQSLDLVAYDHSAGRLDVTDFGHEVFDAAAIVAQDQLTAVEHQELEEAARLGFERVAELDESYTPSD
jgi:hypothetical protein